jgi:hypothetical protein
MIAAALLTMAALLFTRLGHYALWDDEAITALGAKAIILTGDTSVLVDHSNIVGYRGGVNITDFHDRLDPPLPSYLAAASFLLFGPEAWTARVPFALSGLAALALIMFWARKENWPFILVLAFGLIGNVSLILYFRQCRYYGPMVFLSVAIAFVYWRGKPTPRTLLTLAALSILLFASNCMDYLALYTCLAIDYLIWKRMDWPPTWRNGLLLFGPQVILNGIIGSIWNPLKTPFGGNGTSNTFIDRLTLFFWYWRDLDRCEFFALPILLLALGVGVVQKRAWLVRGCLAILVYITVITVISPQPVSLTSAADVRYVAEVIPLAVALEAGALCVLLARRKILLMAAALLVFGTNLLNGGPLLDWGFRSTILCYAGELLHPLPEPYTPTAQWINGHVPAGGTIWVLPEYANYPLMFHAPDALYAWQLTWPPRPDFAGLPRIHFVGQVPPDYLIAFGPSLDEMAQAIRHWNRPDVSYQRVATIDVFWKDLYRPELFWRTFQPITNFDPNSQAVYIFQRTRPPIAAH